MPYGISGPSASGSGLMVGSGVVSSGTLVANGAQVYGWTIAAITLLLLALLALRVFMAKHSAGQSGGSAIG